MNFWTFLDRNWFWCITPVVLIVLVISDCGKREAKVSGCGMRIEVSSDGGAP